MDSVWRRLVGGNYQSFALGALVIVILLAQGLSLWRSYQATWLLATRSAENVMRTVASNIERNLSVIELSLIGLEDAVTAPGVADLPSDLRRMVLFDRAAGAHYLGSMLVLDREGDIVYDSVETPPRRGNFADRDYFKAQLQPYVGTYVSAPFASRLRGGDPSIALSRRVSDHDGRFYGVVLGAVRIAYFQSLLETVTLRAGTAIALTRTDGTVILRFPSTDGHGNVGASVARSPVFLRMMNGYRPFTERSAFDRTERYYVYSVVGNFPLVLSVGISTAEALREWNEQAIIWSAVTAAMCVIILLMFRSLQLALLRSREMEAELEMLAVTDGLTGLPNRRAFDMAVATEVRRAARDKTSLAVLMIDIDDFKKVNDRHGHGVGDQVLARVGRQILRSIRRPGNFAARYGGEEFVVILPATDATGALHVGERIRAGVAAMVPSPADLSLERVSVSIGIAIRHIAPGEPPATIINRADEALYAAKGAGRDRVMIAAVRAEV